ncbi:MAG: hypothetical protein JWM80_5981 [Cyanobacteria bacterium RYN_339]|nr:hypothetical protein [Cyanobacteria bacterium RYN_339]
MSSRDGNMSRRETLPPMDDSRPARRETDLGKEPPKPTWTERSVPENVKPGPTNLPYDPENINVLIPAADTVVQAGYGRTGMLPVRPVMNRGDGGTDALVIQKVAKQTRVLNFRVEGIHWRAGFAPEVGQTPLAQYYQDAKPPAREVQTGTGFVLRPVEPELEAVLRDIIPPNLLKLEEDMFGRKRSLGGAYLYFIPHAGGAAAGMVAWYIQAPDMRAHLVYIQTEIKKADPRILDEMHKTFRASLVARDQVGSTPRPFDFWTELRDATEQVESTLRQSSLGNGEVAKRVSDAREVAEDKLFRNINSGLGRLAKLGHTVFVRVPQLALAGSVKVLSRGAVVVIRAVDRLVAPKPEEPPTL